MIRTIVRGEDVAPIATLVVDKVERARIFDLEPYTFVSTYSGETCNSIRPVHKDVLNVLLKTSSGRSLALQVPATSVPDFQIGATFDLIPRPKD